MLLHKLNLKGLHAVAVMALSNPQSLQAVTEFFRETHIQPRHSTVACIIYPLHNTHRNHTHVVTCTETFNNLGCF